MAEHLPNTMLQLTGQWSVDSHLLLTTHCWIDCAILFFWTIYATMQEINIAQLECSPLSTQEFCNASTIKSVLPAILVPVAIAGALIAVVYTYLIMDSATEKQHPRVVFVWNALHSHFMVSILIFLMARHDYALVVLPLYGLCQDVYCMLRTGLSEMELNAPATESFKEDCLVYGCVRLKRRSSRFFFL